ncbi:biotin--[acetyl-CoA-carboxylase] ligase [Paenibacillus sp. GXUN7292]|uniref:biotin--[acetyl-CoA-carboxylase] ligase n=1 Tax=Paenibacillus sp. GXUN7292 TaxID=3422499 RepID=UPI003D7CD51C
MNPLIKLFHNYPAGFISGAKLSEELGVSRTAIWKQIRKLEAQGYEFEASTKLGYRLVSAPKLINEEQLKKKLRTERFGKQLKLFDAVDSTQNVAREAAENGAAEGALFIAEQQNNGRGRMGRVWISPAGKGIWMSLVLRPDMPVQFAPQLTLLTAVALCTSLREQTRLPIGIKWPNDLLIDRKKISGILLESTAEDTRLKYIIAGIGISVNLCDADYEAEMLSKAVSLRMAAGRQFDREDIIAHFLEKWEQLYDLYKLQGFQAIVPLWESLSVSIGKAAVITTPQGVIIGVPTGLEESGAIKVRLEDGSEKSIFSAEMGEPLD